MEETKKKSLGTGEAIVLAGFLIAIAIFITNYEPKENKEVAAPLANTPSMEIVAEADNLYGDKDAEVFLVEYSDYDCPFCARFHPTAKKLVDESDGKVAWVYKQFPLTSIHPNAMDKSILAICTNKILGNDAFWMLTDYMFANTVTVEDVKNYSISLGADSSKLTECTSSQEAKDKVLEEMAEGKAFGATGTPFTIVISKDGDLDVLQGAQPYESAKQVIDNMLSK